MRTTLPRLLHRSAALSRPLASLPRQSSGNSSTPPIRREEPTTFSAKSAPKEIHDRPEMVRGFPPSGRAPSWAKGGGGPVPKPNSVNAAPPQPEGFSGPSRRVLMYERPEERDLPKLKNRIPLYILLGLLGATTWGLVVFYATNAERLASSVVRQLSFQLRNSPEVSAVLGERVKMVENWWSFGDPYISGMINTMQGRVDLSFRVQGSRQGGTVYFTSIRPKQEGAWRIVRYKVITDSGEVIMLEE